MRTILFILGLLGAGLLSAGCRTSGSHVPEAGCSCDVSPAPAASPAQAETDPHEGHRPAEGCR